MIYVDPGDRRADTMNIVAEGLAQQHSFTGEFRLVATACGYLEQVLINLAGFYEAGVIYAKHHQETGGSEHLWKTLAWTRTGEYLWNQWRTGPARRIVPVAEQKPEAAQQLPRFAAQMLIDAGWTINGVWHDDPIGYFVISISRFDGDDVMPAERVLVLSGAGRTLLNLGDAEAKRMVPMLLAASL